MSELKLNKSLEYLKNLKLGDATYNSKIQRLCTQISESKKLILQIENFADAYNFDQHTPQNGFRSIIEVYFIAIKQTLEACDKPTGIKKLYITRTKQLDDIQNFCEIIDNFLKMFQSLIEFHKNSNVNGSLIAEEGCIDNVVMKAFENISVASFYGQNIGFHMETPPMFMSRQFSIAINLFAYFYFSGKSLLMKLLSIPMLAIKYFVDDNSRALKNEELIRHADLDFLKFSSLLFWSNLSCMLQNIFNRSLKINREIKVAPEPLQMKSSKQTELLNVEVPQCYIGVRPVSCQLFSAKARKGMVGVQSTVEPSKSLVLHVHGGGFYAQSPQSHEVYLRDWAVELDIPILSVKYSLAPKAPFPRALDEIFYVYCWILQCSHMLGSTGENIILVGDSAGANLITALTVKCIEKGVQVPKGILGIYGLYLSNYSAIPSMMLCFMDISLHYGHMLRIFKAYAGHHKSQTNEKDEQVSKAPADEFSEIIPKNHLMSPIFASNEIFSQFPKTTLLTTNLDPCLDENIEMGKKLRAAGVDVKLDVLHGLMHGFLHMMRACRRSYKGSMICVQHIQDLISNE